MMTSNIKYLDLLCDRDLVHTNMDILVRGYCSLCFGLLRYKLWFMCFHVEALRSHQTF